MSGTLFICGTPIGNLDDISNRCVRVLSEADIIAAEDTRHTLKLLNRYEIKTHLISYHEHNERERGDELVQQLLSGKNVALVTDSGMPCLSDPGHELIRMCHENKIKITSAPGPSAAITALALSGIPCGRFIFEGFLSREKKKRAEILRELSSQTRAIILYEAPHRLLETLLSLKEHFGERRAAVIREMTKIHEEIILSDIPSLYEHFSQVQPRGEFVIVIEGLAEQNDDKEFFLSMSIQEHLDFYASQGLSKMDAMKQVAKDRGIGKREVYSEIHGN